MTVIEYAKKKGVSKQSVYDRLRRGTLQYEVINGVKHIVESSPTLKPIEEGLLIGKKKYNKALKKHRKLKHRFKVMTVQLKSMQKQYELQSSEIASLKKALELLGVMINENKSLPNFTEVVDVTSKKKKSKKKKKKK